MIDSYYLFEKQLIDAIKEFPNLQIKEKGTVKYLKGILDIKNHEQKYIRSFLIEIHYSEGFPYRFPLLLEVGDDINCHPDWHKYDDNSCCIAIEPDEILKCHNGMTITRFIRNEVIPYLANQCYKIITGKYKDEYAHGVEGLISYYTELMKTSDKDKWLQNINYAFNIEKHNIGRNKPCFCGSGKKIKKCHSLIFNQLNLIGRKNLIKHLSKIL